ncbi:RING-H2 finger protein ATL66 [Linum perenne]
MASSSTTSSEQTRPDHWHFTELEDHQFQIKGRTLFFAILTFALVLSVVLVLLCTRWLYRYRQRRNGVSHAPGSDGTPQCRGLDAQAIAAIPITLHVISSNSDSDSGAECCICLGTFEEGDKVKSLPRCHHCFHSDCVDRWLLAHSDCPLCRASVGLVDDDNNNHVVIVVDSVQEPEISPTTYTSLDV